MGRTSLGAILLLCIPGLIALWFAARSADALRHELATWPRVQAHVDSATIAKSTSASRTPTYARRIWLTYVYDGRTHARRMDGVYSSDSAGAARAVDAAERQGTATLLIDPQHPADFTLDPGYTVFFFRWPLILAGVAVVLLALGVAVGTHLRDDRSEAVRAPRPRVVASSRRDAALAGMLGVVCLGIALAVAFAAYHRRTSWVATQAAIDSVDVVQRSRSQEGAGYVYAARLWVAYEFGGHVYLRPVMSGATWHGTHISAERDADAAWHAGPTTVFVNPGDPLDVTLDPMAASSLVVPAAFGLAGIALLVFAVDRRRSTRRSPG